MSRSHRKTCTSRHPSAPTTAACNPFFFVCSTFLFVHDWFIRPDTRNAPLARLGRPHKVIESFILTSRKEWSILFANVSKHNPAGTFFCASCTASLARAPANEKKRWKFSSFEGFRPNPHPPSAQSFVGTAWMLVAMPLLRIEVEARAFQRRRRTDKGTMFQHHFMQGDQPSYRLMIAMVSDPMVR